MWWFTFNCLYVLHFKLMYNRLRNIPFEVGIHLFLSNSKPNNKRTISLIYSPLYIYIHFFLMSLSTRKLGRIYTFFPPRWLRLKVLRSHTIEFVRSNDHTRDLFIERIEYNMILSVDIQYYIFLQYIYQNILFVRCDFKRNPIFTFHTENLI